MIPDPPPIPFQRRLIVFGRGVVLPRDGTLNTPIFVIGIDLPTVAFPLARTSDVNPDFWDVIVDPLFDFSPYLVVYNGVLNYGGRYVVERDLFGPGDWPHTWAGWPIPGEDPPAFELPPPPEI